MSVQSEHQKPRVPAVSVPRRLLFSLLPVTCLCVSAEVVARLWLPDSDTASRLQQMRQVCIYLGNRPGNDLFAADSDCFWKLKKNVVLPKSHGPKWGGRMSNGLGFRNPEMQLAKPQATQRIVCYGDSTTFGFGVAMQEAWPALLEIGLQQSTANAYQVVNAGVPGYSSFQGHRYLKRSLPRLTPDLIIATFGNNDAWRWDDRSDRAHATRLQQLFTGWNWRQSQALAALSQIAQADSAPTAATDAAWARRVSQNFFQPVTEWRPRVNLQEFAENLQQMVGICRAQKIPLVLLVWPDYFQVQGRLTIRNRYQHVIRQTALQHQGVHCIDLLPVFRGLYPTSLGFYLDRDIIHINAAGNRVVANTLEQLLPRFLPLAGRAR